jgi:hypothetical protein
MGEEHRSDEFGKQAPTVFGANVNDPELTSLSAPYMIRQRGVDERQAAGNLVARPPRPSVVELVPIWVWVLVLVIMFLAGVSALVFMASQGVLEPPQ